MKKWMEQFRVEDWVVVWVSIPLLALAAIVPAGLPKVPATLLGGATEVGDNVVIGGNAFLTESVESDTKVSIKKPEMTFRVKGGRF